MPASSKDMWWYYLNVRELSSVLINVSVSGSSDGHTEVLGFLK